MELMYIIYLIEVGTNIKMWDLSDLILIVLATHIPIAVFGGLICGTLNEDFTPFFKYRDFVLRKIVILPLLLVFGFGSLFNALMPSKQIAYLMLGAYGVQSVAETVGKNEEAQKIGKSTLKLINSAIEKYQKELDSQSEKPVDTEKE